MQAVLALGHVGMLIPVGLSPDNVLSYFLYCTQLLEVAVSLGEENDVGSFLHGKV